MNDIPVLKPYEHELSSATLRRIILEFARAGNAVHIPCSFSIVELLAVLYERYVRLNWEDRSDPRRDILALSKGHGVMALYACFREFGWLEDKDVQSYFGPTNRLPGLSSVHVPGVEITGGSLGHGLPVSVGLAFAAKLKETDRRVYCIVGDGEMNEGSNWESLLFASQHGLDNLAVVVDDNSFQAMGRSKEILDLSSLKKKFESFNFDSYDVDGHSRVELADAFDEALKNGNNGHPKAVIARTVKGKGVSFMEAANQWHYTRLDDLTYQAAMKEL